MKKYSIVGICQIYNELEKGNLSRFIEHFKPLVSRIIAYDDSSTDGSYEYLLDNADHVLRGSKNKFVDEIDHKQELLEAALKFDPDFILWLDADEVFSANAEEELQELCEYCIEKNFDALSFHEVNLWRSSSWCRKDNLYDAGWFVRLWRVQPGISFKKIRKGLHQQPYPSTIKLIEKTDKVKVIHYGFASEKSLAFKYLVYKSHGQTGYLLDRFINEDEIELEKVARELFPEDLWFDDEKPEYWSRSKWMTYINSIRDAILRPKFTIISLIYKSPQWAEFVYEQVLKNTDMSDKEFFFIANDPTDDVVNYLEENYIPHYIFQNSEGQRAEWYINNVYRAYNYGVKQAKGDVIVFINSDMAFSPDWFENLWRAYDGSNCISSRLVESGKMKSGLYGVEKNFGYDIPSFSETEFLKYAQNLTAPEIHESGLYMPLLVNRKHFLAVGGYPEGNIAPDSNIYRPVIARQGDPNISGDRILIRKLQNIGVRHETAFDSIVYHFQCGELNDTITPYLPRTRVAICNDLIRGINGERVLWTYLSEQLPAAIGIGSAIVGPGNYSKRAKEYIDSHHPTIDVVVQNATFIDLIDPSRHSVVYVQDNLRKMETPSAEQEYTIHAANIRVANSIDTALSYPEYDFRIIPVGVDEDLFVPMDKGRVRDRLGFEDGLIGIFVGSFSEVKGWSEVVKCIENFPNITWIAVSKYEEKFFASNVRVYNKIPQEQLVELLNCADFFIVGSRVETQCLAAIEACLCDVPVVMHEVGIFKEFSDDERAKVGVFTDDLIEGVSKIQDIIECAEPRRVILGKGLGINQTIDRWKRVLEEAFQEVTIKKNQQSSPTASSWLNKCLFCIDYMIRYKLRKILP